MVEYSSLTSRWPRPAPVTVHRSHILCTAAPVGPAAARRWAACAASSTTCNARPCRVARHAHRGHGRICHRRAISEQKGHPFRLTFDDLEIGDAVTTESRVVSRQDIDDFAEATGDTFYAHMDEEAASRSPIFGGLVAHGYLVLSYAAGLFVWPDEGPVLANYGIDKLRFATPTYPGDEIHVVLTCKRKTQLDGRGYGEVAWDTRVINQNGEVAAAYDVLTMVANAPE